jgi:broad specificity phosphatase PhoE
MATSNVVPVRRVTGSADIPLSPEGRTQVAEMAQRYSHPFDHVFCGPEARDIETAREFSPRPIILKGLDAWARGAYEAQPAKLVQAAMRNLILHPDIKPPGKSPISGLPGESYNTFLKPLMHVMRTIKEHIKPKERLLLVTSGGDLQGVDQLASAGFPAKIDQKHFEEIAKKPYWSATGQLFKLTDHGLEKVDDNKEPGCYLSEHGASAWNSPKDKPEQQSA